VLAEDVHCFEITFDDAVTPAVADPLFPYIPLRYTNRRYYRTTPLTDAHKRGLEEALGDTLAITWRSNWKERWQMGTLNMQAYAIRMKSRTAYEQLKNQLDWQHPFSADKLPVHTLPVTALSRQIMRWAMVSWRRLETLGKIPGALLPSAMELELLPALFCGAHFIIARKNVPAPENYITAAIAEGRALMRFWLTLTRLGLTMQPSYSPIVFGHYGNHPDDLPPGEQHLVPHCQHLAKKLAAVSGHDPKQIVFMGRIGIPRTTAIASRSLRKPLEALLVEKSQ
jgi:hypothetical protein